MPQTQDLGNAENTSGVNQSSPTPASGVSSAQVLADSSNLPVTPGQGATPGLKGADRFNQLMGQAPTTTDAEAAWLWAIPDDPTDPEFTRLVHERQAQWAANGYPAPNKGAISFAQSKPDKSQDRSTSDAAGRATAQASKDALANSASLLSASQTAKQQKQDQAQYRSATSGKPLVVGLPVDANQILSDASRAAGSPVGIPSEWLKDFTKNWDLNLDGDYSAGAVKSGDYIYVGTVADDSGGKGYKRDKYVYKEDAKAMLSGMDPNKIKAYQARLGQTVTGIPDAQLQALWSASVDQAGMYARAGKKVDVSFIFDTLVGAKAASLSGGGGGGGGNGLEKGAVDQAGVDYYHAMMQVLGDISGVGAVRGS